MVQDLSFLAGGKETDGEQLVNASKYFILPGYENGHYEGAVGKADGVTEKIPAKEDFDREYGCERVSVGRFR